MAKAIHMRPIEKATGLTTDAEGRVYVNPDRVVAIQDHPNGSTYVTLTGGVYLKVRGTNARSLALDLGGYFDAAIDE